MSKLITAIALGAATVTAMPAMAAPTLVTSVQVKNIYPVSGQGYLQIAELQLFKGLTNFAPAGTATATSVYPLLTPVPSNANNGSTDGNYYSPPGIYHGAASDGSDIFTLTLAAPTALNRISIYGRTDGYGYRDIYSYSFLNGTNVVRAGTLDATATGFATGAVPEPALWGMMIVGFGAVGASMRRRKVAARVAFA